jgi:predicted PurR-regulated permease PerM
MLALDPDQFQTAAIAWIGAFVVVASAVALAIAKVAPLIQQVKELFLRVERQNNRIDNQQQQITQVALQTPAASTSSPQQVEVVQPPDKPVPVTEK